VGRLREKLTYANVMATLAVFIALGGSSYAALKLPKNSVGSKQIKRNAVTSTKVKNRTLLSGDFKRGQILTPGVADGRYLLKAGVPLRSLDADKLDGLDSSAFARGTIVGRTIDLRSPATGNVSRSYAIPGIGTITFECSTGLLDAFVLNQSGGNLRVAFSPSSSGFTNTPNGTALGLAQANPAPSTSESSTASWIFGRDVDGARAGTLEAYTQATRPASGETTCRGGFVVAISP
jgi:hypothetical protein